MSDIENEKAIFDAIMRVDNLPTKGRRLKVDLNEEQCKDLAKILKIDKIQSLKANLLAEQVKGGFHAIGDLSAKIIQPCVVSFKPVEQKIDEKIDRIFLRAKEPLEETKEQEFFVEMGGDDLPDYYMDKEIDFSDLIVEILVLAVNDFPRLTGEKLDIIKSEPVSSPFDILANLKNTNKS